MRYFDPGFMIQLIEKPVVKSLPVQKEFIGFLEIRAETSQERSNRPRRCDPRKKSSIPVKSLVAVTRYRDIFFLTSFFLIIPTPLVIVTVPVTKIEIEQPGSEKSDTINAVIVVLVQLLEHFRGIV